MVAISSYRAPGRVGVTSPILISIISLIIYTEVFLSRVTGLPFRAVLSLVVILLALMLVAKILARHKIQITCLVFLLSICLFSMISSLGGLEPSLFRSILSSIIFSKFIMVFLLARYISIENFGLPMRVLAVVHVFGCALSLLYPQFFASLLPQASFEIDASRLMGFSLNANRAAAVSSILLLYFAFCERKFVYSAVFLLLLLLSESRSVTVITALIFGFLILISRLAYVKKLFLIIVGLVSFVIAFSFFLSLEDTLLKIENTLHGELRYIRAAMLAGGASLATEFFPFGAGGGLFGSSLSRGSEAYILVGISDWDTVINMTGVYDSGLGAILGEYGYAGFLIYTIVVFFTLRYALSSPSPYHITFFLTFLVLFMGLFRTVASDFFYSFYFLFVFAFINHLMSRKESSKCVSS